MPSTQLKQTAIPQPASLLQTALNFSPTASRESDRRLTIHRRTHSHHGHALQILGHAAEALSADLAFEIDPKQEAATRQALHILMQLSRSIFDEYAEETRQTHPVTDWMMRQAIRIYGAA